jgi:O-antigen/teichoic acid export membrane protein
VDSSRPSSLRTRLQDLLRAARPAQEHGARRSHLLRFAVIGSLVSKASGLALQALAIPLVYHSLGQHRYELFLLLTAALASISLAQLGAGPGLTQGLARAHAARAHEQEAALLRAAFRLTSLAAMIGGAIVLTIIHTVPHVVLFGAVFANDRAAIMLAANVCVLVLMAQMVSGVVDSALAGYQEQVFTAVGSMTSNLLSIVLLFFLAAHAPTIINVVLVLYGAPTLSRLSNLIALVRRRPYLAQGLLRPARGFYAALLGTGLAFWAMELCSMLEQYGGTFVLSHNSSTQDTDVFSIVYKALVLVGALVNVITQPLWPAITDAIAHGDVPWVQKAYGRIRRAVSTYSLALFLATVTIGPWFFQRILRVDTTGYYSLFLVFGVYFTANIWTHLFYVTMMGMNAIWKIAVVQFAENVLMLLFGIILTPRFGATGMALAYLLASVLLPVWLLPRLMQRQLQEISAARIV